MYCCFCTAAPQKFYSDKPFFFQIPLPRSFLRQCGGKATMGSALPILFHGSLFGIVHQRKVGIEEGFSRFLFLLRRCLSFSFFRNVKTNSDCAGGKRMKTILILEKFSYQVVFPIGDCCFSNTTQLESNLSQLGDVTWLISRFWFVCWLNARDDFKEWG